MVAVINVHVNVNDVVGFFFCLCCYCFCCCCSAFIILMRFLQKLVKEDFISYAMCELKAGMPAKHLIEFYSTFFKNF